MDLVDLIEKRRFVGREFLVWLWFESELLEGEFQIPGVGGCSIWLENQITLIQEKEQSKLKGATPSANPEAHEALRQGKLPTQARVRLIRGDFEYAFLFTADTLALSGVKIPAVVKKEADEQFYERMYLIEALESLFGALYADFVAIRLSAAWEAHVAPAIRAWVKGEETIDPDAYRKLCSKVVPLRAKGSTKGEGKPAPQVGLAEDNGAGEPKGKEAGARRRRPAAAEPPAVPPA